MEKSIFQLKVTLKGSKPPIWRRLLLKADTPLADVHIALQNSMGWYNCHLHQFIHEGQYFSAPMGPEDDTDFSDGEIINYADEDIRLMDFLPKEKAKFQYEYDFGDSWIHEVVLENVQSIDENQYYPYCIGGSMTCPPENCGGIPGYSHILKVLKKPNHEEYEDIMEWLDEDFDPTKFDKDEVNELFKRASKARK